METDGVIRSTRRAGKDGYEGWEIHVVKTRASALPYVEAKGNRTTVSLIIDGQGYQGFTKATPDYENVWISPVLYDIEGKRTSLARALNEAGLEKNQRVRLSVDGKQITISALDSLLSMQRKLSSMSERVFGEIPGYPEGSLFASRQQLSQAGVHRPTQAGISGSQTEGADSIVLSGGYEDDQDSGDIIVYTGHGGRDAVSGKQTSHQMLVQGNKALALSRKFGLPVRVVRGSTHASPFSPATGYKYDGLYRVEDHWKERGLSGFNVWRFRLVKVLEPAVTIPQSSPNAASLTVNPPNRVDVLTSRIVRDTRQSRRIKEMYDYRCQICGVRLEGNAGPYAEAAHVRPLGRPHDGPDTLENLLCLCPNHHVLFDYGGIAIAEDYGVIGTTVKLTLTAGHNLDLAFIRYHRERYGFDAT